MESSEHYYNKDGWPPEVDRQVMIRLAAEIPVAEVNSLIYSSIFIKQALIVT